MATNYQAQVDQYNKKIAEAQANGGKTASGVTLSQLQSGLASAQSKLASSATPTVPTVPTATVSNSTYTPAYIPSSTPQNTWSFNEGVSALPGEGKWVTKPTINYAGQLYNFDTPQQVVAKMDEIRSAGQANSLSSGNFDAMYKYYSEVARDWKPTSTNVPTAMDLGYDIPVTNYEKTTGLPQSTAGTNQTAQTTPQYNTNDSFVEKMKIIQQMFYPQKEQAPAYQSPYSNTINNLLALLTERVSNPTQYDPNTDAGLRVAQDNAILAARRDLGRRGMIGSNSGIYGDMGEIQAAQKLIPQYQQMFQQTEQQKLNNMYNQLSALQGLESTKYNQYRDTVGDVNYKNQMNLSDILSLANLTGTVNNADLAKTQQIENQNNKFGNAYNPQTGAIQQTPDALAAETARYEASITGLGDTFDYQAEYNKIKNDNDPSNDYKLAPLARQREAKIQSQIAGLAKYSSDYQAEINRREANERVNGITDPLLPYLRVLRAQKVASMNAEALSRQDKTIKDAYDRWTKLGVADQTVASVLGIPVGSKTADYQKAMADIAQSNASAASSYASANAATMNAQTNRAELDYKKSQGTSEKNLTTQQKNEYYADAYQKIRVLPVAQAKTALINGRQELESTLGNSQYKALVNDVLRAAGISYEQLFEE